MTAKVLFQAFAEGSINNGVTVFPSILLTGSPAILCIMNLIFRLLAICVSYLCDRTAIAPLDTSRLGFRVWPLDLDANIHMNNGRYLSIMDLGRLDLIMRVGIMGEMLRRKWMPVLSAATIRYRIPLHPFQKFHLDTRVIWWDKKWFYMEQRFILCGGAKDGAVAAIAFVKGSFYDRKTKTTVPSGDITALMGITETPPKPDYINSWDAAEQDMRKLTTPS